MKARLTTVLSLSGVLVAGSAAALVNTEVLRPSTPVRAGQLSTGTLQLGSAADTTLAAPPAASQATYGVAQAGSVTLDTADERLVVVSVAPAPGWTVVSSTNADATTIEVVLQAGTVQTTFRAALLYGVVNTSVDSDDLADTSASNTVRRTHHESGTDPTSTESSGGNSNDGGSQDESENTEQDD